MCSKNPNLYRKFCKTNKLIKQNLKCIIYLFVFIELCQLLIFIFIQGKNASDEVGSVVKNAIRCAVLKDDKLTVSRSSELVNLVQKELETEETKTNHLFRIINVEVAGIDAFWQSKEELNLVTIKDIRGIHFLHSNVDGIWAKKISCRECTSSYVCHGCRAHAIGQLHYHPHLKPVTLRS